MSPILARAAGSLALRGNEEDTPHRPLIFRFKLAIKSELLIDRQCLSLGMAGDQLKLDVSHSYAGVPREMKLNGTDLFFRISTCMAGPLQFTGTCQT